MSVYVMAGLNVHDEVKYGDYATAAIESLVAYKVEVLAVSDAAVATSGEYERGGHIWGGAYQPRGGSVTVVGPRIEIADALATALWACADPAPRWLQGFPEYGVLRLGAAGPRLAG